MKLSKQAGAASLVLIVALFALLLAVGYLANQRGILRRQAARPTAHTASQVTSPAQIIDKLNVEFDAYVKRHPDLKRSPDTYSGAANKQGDHYYIINSSHTSLVQVSTDILPIASIDKLNHEIGNLSVATLGPLGLALDVDQTFQSGYKQTQVTYSGKNLHCSMRESPPETAPFTYLVTCYSDAEMQAAVAAQQPILAAFDKDTIIGNVQYSKTNKNFAQIGIGSINSGGGAVAIVQKTGSTWKSLIAFQNTPSCAEVDGKGIPADLLATCIDNGQERAIH